MKANCMKVNLTKINLAKINLAKTTIFTLCFLCFLCATAAFGQTASVLSSYAQPTVMPEHLQHASEHALAKETSLLSTSTYGYAQGEQPLVEFGTLPYETPLGDVARAYRKEHATTAKAVKVLDK
jgi:hypothetical protein